MPLVLETHRDKISIERPQILDQAVLVFLRPLAREEFDDRGAALKKLRTVTPDAVFGVGERDLDRVARIPGVFRHDEARPR